MSPLDGPLAAVAQKLIRIFGTSAKLTRTKTRMDEVTNDVVDDTKTYDVKVTPPSPYKQNQINGTTILATDVQLLLASKEIGEEILTPKGWDLSVKGRSLSVVSVMPIFSGEQIAAYQVQARG